MSTDICDRVYDAYLGEMGQQFMRETQRRIHWMCAATRGQSLLDVGCSQGLLPILVAREGKLAVGVDNQTDAIRAAEAHLASEPPSVRKRVSLIEADFATYDFGDARFDCIVMGEVLEHLLDPARFIAKAASLMSAGGRLVVTVPFGINDHADHKHTFYLLKPFRLLSEHFDCEEVTILGKWLGLVGVRREVKNDEPRQPSPEALAQMEAAFAQVERELVDNLATLRSRLDDANVKYRSSTEEVARLKREVAHHESERKAAEKAREQAATELKELRQHSPRVEVANDTQLLGEVRARHATEIELARLQERLTNVERIAQLELKVREDQLEQRNERQRSLELELKALQARVAEQERAIEMANTQTEAAKAQIAELGQIQRELEQTERERNSLLHQLAQAEAMQQTLQVELRASNDDVAQLIRRVATAESERRTLEESLAGAGERENQHQRELFESNQKLQELAAVNQAQVERIQLLEAANREREQRERERDQRDRERDQRERALQAELALNRSFAQAEHGAAAQESLQAAEQRAIQLEQQLQLARQSERRATTQLERERRQRVAAEQAAAQTRTTLSFQLGYELIQSFKSRERLLRLPANLWQLQQEAARRRRQKQLKSASANATSATPTGAAPRSEAAPEAKAVRVQPSTPSARPAPPEPLASAVIARDVVPPKPPRGTLAELRVACIHDEFTFSSYSPECKLQQLTPHEWRRELEELQPQLLFVESAWRGKNDLWDRKVAYCSHELLQILEWCRSHGVPTAFWNKEDPVHFRTFLNTAKLFDFVFTTDMDCIQRYVNALGHSRVFLLPFALQPALHNPIEKYRRKNAVCFAGAYYARYPERQADLASFLQSLSITPGIEIYDRNHGKNNADYQFPEVYQRYIVGTLPFDEIDKAYKGYRYALNLNSIKASQTMFARRVYELLGSNTITLSNFSRGLRLMFGDLVITTDQGERALAELKNLMADESRSRRFRLAGLRKVLSEHTYGHRLRFVAESVWGQPLGDDLPAIVVLAAVRNAEEARTVLSSFERQAHPEKRLIIVAEEQLALTSTATGTSIRCLRRAECRDATLVDAVGNASHVASLVASDHWGRHYLSDLALATRYSSADAIGKGAYYAFDRGGLELKGDGLQYTAVPSLPARSAIVRKSAIGRVGLLDWLDTMGSRRVEAASCLAIDEFNYCRDGAAASASSLEQVEDLQGLDPGLPLAHLLENARALPPREATPLRQRQIDALTLSRLFKSSSSKPISVELQGNQLLITSSLPDATHEYLYASQPHTPAELGFQPSGKFHLDVTPGLNVQLAFVFLNAEKKRVGNKVCQAGTNDTVQLPEGATTVQLGLRIYGAGTAKLNALLLDHVQEAPDRLLGRADVLLVTNHYPTAQDLYRNGFVHRRVLEYRKQGSPVDVFRVRAGEKPNYHEFDGVDVVSGGYEALETLLRSNRYRAILVHFLSAPLWPVLRNHLDTTRVLIWLHGAEIQAWHRRESHYATPEQLALAKSDTEARTQLWRGIIEELGAGSKLIFVSRQFAREVMTDLDVTLPDDKYEIIHNVIDTTLFDYRPKSAAQRTRILSVRPYTSRIYGNDLAVAAILELKQEPFFEQLEFHLIGDGPLFEETTAPLRNLRNVRLERRFLAQSEIAALHKNYGVFLCPSRGDTQGVSRDEAMSSGLVPITNAAGAVPEFVDESCGFLAEREDHVGLAEGIARLYRDADLFARMSAQAAKRVRQQSGPPQTTQRELQLFALRQPATGAA